MPASSTLLGAVGGPQGAAAPLAHTLELLLDVVQFSNVPKGRDFYSTG